MKLEKFITTLCISAFVLLCLSACASGRKTMVVCDELEAPSGMPRTLLLVGQVSRDSLSQTPTFTVSRLWTEEGDMGELFAADEAEDDLTFYLLNVGGTRLSTCRIANPLQLHVETAGANGTLERTTLKQDSGTVFVRLPFTPYNEPCNYTLMGKQNNMTFYKQIIEP